MNGPVELVLDERGVATITLVRGDSGNVLNAESVRALAGAVEAVRGARAVVLGARGRLFCGGGDVAAFRHAEPAAASAAVRGLAESLHALMLAMGSLDAPVIARVHATAAGAGLSLVAAADLAVAAETATFTLAYTRIGFSPDGGSSFFLPRAIGLRRSLELAITNRVLTAREALEWGLVNHVVAPEALDESVAELARSIAGGPTGAFGATKRLLLHGATADLRQQLRAEEDAIAERAASADGLEGVAAFLERRPASFTGAE